MRTLSSCACAGVAGDGEVMTRLLQSNMQLFTFNTGRQPHCVQVCRAVKQILFPSVPRTHVVLPVSVLSISQACSMSAFASFFYCFCKLFYFKQYNNHQHKTWEKENLHLTSVSKDFGKRSVKYKASKLWNQLPLSLKDYCPVKQFGSKLKIYLQLADIDTTKCNV